MLLELSTVLSFFHVYHCAEVWGNTYPSNILPVHLKQKKAIRIIA